MYLVGKIFSKRIRKTPCLLETWLQSSKSLDPNSFEIWGATSKVQLILWKETRYTKEKNRKIYKFPGLKIKTKFTHKIIHYVS